MIGYDGSRDGAAWRRGWDSNPRYHLWYTPLAGERLRPLGHLSGKPAVKDGGRGIKRVRWKSAGASCVGSASGKLRLDWPPFRPPVGAGREKGPIDPSSWGAGWASRMLAGSAQAEGRGQAVRSQPSDDTSPAHGSKTARRRIRLRTESRSLAPMNCSRIG